MNAFLKGYYGYKNLGDEILMFGVFNYIFKNFQISDLYVEVDDIKWMKEWTSRHSFLMEFNQNSIHFLEKGSGVPADTLKIFGGGEVLADQRPFPYDGWNILLKFGSDVIKKNFILLGGIGTPRKVSSKWLYNILIKKAKAIVVRENKSYNICFPLNSKTVLYHDFAFDIIDKFLKGPLNIQEDKILININSYIYNQDSINKILEFCEEYKTLPKYFVPFDMFDDLQFYSDLKRYIPDLQIFDWTTKNLFEVFEFMSSAVGGIGARLHFLLILKWLGKKTTPLAYQEKINKFFD